MDDMAVFHPNTGSDESRIRDKKKTENRLTNSPVCKKKKKKENDRTRGVVRG